MSYMFAHLNSIEHLYINNLQTESLENMDSMFKNCYLLTELSLANFDTKSVTN